MAEDGAKGFVDGSFRGVISNDGATTPTPPSPIEGEGYSRFVRDDRTSAAVVRRARRLRAAPTRTEARLWEHLRCLSVRFRRQAAMGPYVPDFVCHPASLVVEVDGGGHSLNTVALRDMERDAWFESQGYCVVRVSTRQVDEDIEAVVTTIRNMASNRLKRAI